MNESSGMGQSSLPRSLGSRVVYVALTYVPGGGLLTGFAMRSEPKGFSEVSAPLTSIYLTAKHLEQEHYDCGCLAGDDLDAAVCAAAVGRAHTHTY